MTREKLDGYVRGERRQQAATPFLVSDATNAIVQLADQRDRALALLREWYKTCGALRNVPSRDTRALLAEVDAPAPGAPAACDWDGCTASVTTEGDICSAHACNCNPADQTGGGHHPTCQQFDPMHGAEPVQY